MAIRYKPDWMRGLALVLLTLFIIAFAVTMSVPAFGQSNLTPTPGTINGQIAFTSARDGHNQIYLMAPDGSNQVNISKNAFNDSQPSWSPDGSQLAFVSERDGNGEICVMKVDGSNQHCLTNQPTANKKPNPKLPRDYEPTWAPDGQHIAFVSTRTGTADIWAMNADGTNQLDLTQGASTNDQPAWSPDLKSIAFVSDRDGNSEICVMDASGFNQRCLTNERTANKKPDKAKPADSYPAWSPDSQRLVFVSTRERTRNRQIFVMNADGSNPTDITQKISTDDQPSWSCDGQSIAFTSNRDGLIVDIYNASPDGTVQTRLTHTTKGGDFDPDYQPCAPSGTPTATMTPTPTGPITFTAIPTDTPTATGVSIYVPPVYPTNTATSVPTKVPPPPPSNTSKPPAKTNTPGPNNTATPSRTPTITFTPSHTFTPTTTFTPSNTPTSTFTPTATPCPGTVQNGNDSGAGSLRAAVAAAKAGDTITFCPLVKLISLTTGAIAIGQNLTILGNAPQSPTIDGGGVATASGPIFNVTGGTVSIQNLVLTNAVNPASPIGDPGVGGGGAVIQTGGTLTLNNLTVSNSQAPNGQGGGVFVDGRAAGATLTITASTITANSAVTGGGVYGVGANISIGTDQITNNTATVYGGGLTLDFGASLTATGGAFTGNTAGLGGGGLADMGTDGTLNCTTATLTGVSINNNQATNGQSNATGGGVYNSGICTLTINGGTISGNAANGLSASGFGGAIANSSPGGFGTFTTLNLNSVTVSGNTTNGGAAGIYNTLSGVVNVTTSTISGNSASLAGSLGGGGIFNDSNSTVTVIDSTISGNQANQGGGIDNLSTLTMTNSTLANNTASTAGGLLNSGGTATLLQATVFGNTQTAMPGGAGGSLTVTGGTVSIQNSIIANSDGAADPDISGTVNSSDYNLIQNAVGATITGTATHNITGVDPLLQPLGTYNGSTTQILPPSASSPVINTIPNTGGCNGAGITADQRGVARPQPTGGNCDMGSVEYNFALPPLLRKTPTPSKTSTSTPSKTRTPTVTPTSTPSLTRSFTPTVTPTHTAIPPTVTLSPSATDSPSPSATPTSTSIPATATPTIIAVTIKPPATAD